MTPTRWILTLSDNREFPKSEFTKENVLTEDEKAENGLSEEKQPRKRKRNIMNETQVLLIEKALLDEPEMQRNAASLQSWADKLSSQACTNGHFLFHLGFNQCKYLSV